MASTLLQLRSDVLDPIDAIEAVSENDDAMYSVDEVNKYINKGIKKLESLIHNIHEDYFFAKADITVVSGTAECAMPTDIFANKIRKVLYDDGNDQYIINRIKHIEDIQDVVSGDRYKYKLINNLASGTKLTLYPTPTFTNNSFIDMYYIRRAKQLVLDADIIDIPEFEDFVVLYARRECLKKRMIASMLEECKAELAAEARLVVDTLESMIPDEDNNIKIDVSFYEDFYNTDI